MKEEILPSPPIGSITWRQTQSRNIYSGLLRRTIIFALLNPYVWLLLIVLKISALSPPGRPWVTSQNEVLLPAWQCGLPKAIPQETPAQWSDRGLVSEDGRQLRQCFTSRAEFLGALHTWATFCFYVCHRGSWNAGARGTGSGVCNSHSASCLKEEQWCQDQETREDKGKDDRGKHF